VHRGVHELEGQAAGDAVPVIDAGKLVAEVRVLAEGRQPRVDGALGAESVQKGLGGDEVFRLVPDERDAVLDGPWRRPRDVLAGDREGVGGRVPAGPDERDFGRAFLSGGGGGGAAGWV
jgi:hypothetical protein